VVTTRDSDESWQKGHGAPPFDETIDVASADDSDQTILAIEVSGFPLEEIAFYGAGRQIHVENLAGSDNGDVEARWDELVPVYQALAVDVS
jgi:hypothetical protein